MAGYADIDAATPVDGDAATVDDHFRSLKQDILEGANVEHDDGQTTAAFQGYHQFTAGNGAAEPASAARPDGHIYFRNDIADQLVPRRNNTGAVAYAQVGLADLTKVGSKTVPVSVLVNAAATVATTIDAYTAAHYVYQIDAYTNGAGTPTLEIGWNDPAGTNIYVWLRRVKGGNNQIVVRNGTALNENVFILVTRLIH